MKKIVKFFKEKYAFLKTRMLASSTLRGSDELFQSGEVFNASEKELRNILREASTRAVPNELVRHREIVRALVVNNVQNQRHIDKIDLRNQIYTIVIIVLTAINIGLAIQQANYTELSTRSERIVQEQSIQAAITNCKQSPQPKDSGLYDVTTGAPAPCTEILKAYPN